VLDTAGTEAFFPPEACAASGHRYHLVGADVWAAACCLSCLAFGKLPFDPRLSPEALIHAIATKRPAPLVPVTEKHGARGEARGSDGNEADLGKKLGGPQGAIRHTEGVVAEEAVAMAVASGDEDLAQLLDLLLRNLLVKEPSARLSVEAALSHSWLAQVPEDEAVP